MTTQRPIHQVRIGRIVAAIWKNETERGKRHNVTLSKLYKTDSRSDWMRTESFSRDDLLILEKVCDLAFRRIHEQGRSATDDEAA